MYGFVQWKRYVSFFRIEIRNFDDWVAKYNTDPDFLE